MLTPVVEATSHSVGLEGPANALATNKDATQVVVAGRNVFKIFCAEPTKFTEKLNLRIGKNIDLSYSCADVVWNPSDDAVLATAATNGSVVTWNLNSPHKQDMKFQDHKRTVNKVCFHNSEANFLLSGSQDGTMKLFDLRKKEAASTFYSLSESVRDVQFCPHQYFSFAAVQENGYVQLWDLRRTDRFERQFAAHSGPVFTCDWHPEEKFLFATAGRDKTIKVWDTSFKETLEKCIQTIACVSRVKWRPSKKHHIASSSLVVDFTVNVWDIRRQYVPMASFCAHKDVATGFSWRTPNILLTTGKDCALHQHRFSDAARIADRANPVGLHLNARGDIGYAYHRNTLLKEFQRESKGSITAPRLPVVTAKKPPSMQEKFRLHQSALSILERGHEFLSMNWFVSTARRYLLHGKSLPELCEHNSSVAAELDRPDVAQTWLILKLLYTSGSMLLSEFAHIDKMLPDEKVLESSQEKLRPNGNVVTFRPVAGGTGGGGGGGGGSKGGSRHVSGGSHHAADEEDSDSGNAEHENTITYFSSELAQGDFFFGDGDTELVRMLDYSQLSTLPADEDWTLPREAFNIRHRLGDGSPPAELAHLPPNFPAEEVESLRGDYGGGGTAEDEEQSMMLALFDAPRFPPWNFTELVVDMLHYYVEQGDVQMTVSVLLVLGDKIRYTVKDNIQEQWFHSYIDLLSRFRLWNIANEVIALSSLPGINCLNQQSTIVNTQCAKCNKARSSTGFYCNTCKEISVCSICHKMVRGLWVWCQGCGHGGHLQHIQEWFKENRQCPAGCSHMCEYT